jgi:DNA integrity scanning protein DisA with diadenylate cyclase activity
MLADPRGTRLPQKDPQRTGESIESRLIVDHALQIAAELEVRSILVQAEDGRDVRLFDSRRRAERLIWLVVPRRAAEFPASDLDIVLQIPDVTPTRMSPVAIGLFLAVLHGHVGIEETVLCLSGGVGSKRLDTLIVTNPRRDFPWLGDRRLAESFPQVVSHELARILDIALRFASEGREGKPIGTIFVIGDPEELQPHLKQLILNPCAGHQQRKRSIHNKEFLETLREYSALDGAFLVDRKGVVRSAGTYLDAPSRSARLPDGLGARHVAAAAITMATSAVAVAISESSGTVRVYHDGKTILSLERS